MKAIIYKGNNNSIETLPFIKEGDTSFINKLNDISNGSIIKLNSNQRTFCRINYSIEWWNNLGKICEENSISTIDKIGCIL